MSDPGTTYRTRDEVSEMRSKNDVIAGLKKYILDWGVAEESALKEIDAAAKKEVEAAVEEAKKSPFPDLKEFWTDIYVRTNLYRLGYSAYVCSTRVPSRLSCEDEKRKRCTTTTRALSRCFFTSRICNLWLELMHLGSLHDIHRCRSALVHVSSVVHASTTVSSGAALRV